MGTIASPIDVEIQAGLFGNSCLLLTCFFRLKGLKVGTDPESSLDKGNTVEGPGVSASLEKHAFVFGKELYIEVALTEDELEAYDVHDFVEVALVGVAELDDVVGDYNHHHELNKHN